MIVEVSAITQFLCRHFGVRILAPPFSISLFLRTRLGVLPCEFCLHAIPRWLANRAVGRCHSTLLFALAALRESALNESPFNFLPKPDSLRLFFRRTPPGSRINRREFLSRDAHGHSCHAAHHVDFARIAEASGRYAGI